MATTIDTYNRYGERGKKKIFDTGIKKVIIAALGKAGRVVQTKNGDIEEYVAFDNAGKEILKVRENYLKGRSTINFDGETYTKVDARYIDGTINHEYTDAESSKSLNTINEKDFSDLYSLIASRAELGR